MARFDFTSKCAHPRICKRLMTEFLQDATTLTYVSEFCRFLGMGDDGMPILGDSEFGEYDRVVSLKKSPRGFRTNIHPMDESKIEIEYDFCEFTRYHEEHNEFIRNIRARAPFTAGFSSLTLALLHELGHNETEEEVPEYYDRQKALKNIEKYCGKNPRMVNMMYFSLPDEYMATQWAINWLTNTENRKKAKAFEKAFFKAWRG